MGPMLMLDLRSGAVMLKYSDIQVGEMILQSHGTAADAGPPLRGCHAQVFRHTGRRNDTNYNYNSLADILCSGGAVALAPAAPGLRVKLLRLLGGGWKLLRLSNNNHNHLADIPCSGG
jgi:hypothetical protein